MAKARSTIFFCQNCGYESPRWLGQCPGCREWNTFAEEPAPAAKKSAGRAAVPSAVRAVPQKLSEVALDEKSRISTGSGELDRVLGGGIVAGSLVLVGGDPGIGKSTLLLQVCHHLAKEHRVLYISGEESAQQIKMRSQRLGRSEGELGILCETNLEAIVELLEREQPEIVVVDSIQTMYSENVASAPGSVSQVRESTGVFLRVAKGMGITVFLVGHVTKEGAVAGPRVLEHMVDAVLYFEGDRHAAYRILRGVKNRFGSTNEIGVFEMRDRGLTEVANPSEYMLNGKLKDASGSVVSCSMEGTRPVLVEIQALVCKTNLPMPRRTTAGTDFNRVNLLLAVLEKRAGLHLSACDVYVNIAGGIRMTEPAMDLGLALAVASSYRDIAVDPGTIAFGEVGLSGELRAVSMAQQRVREAAKLGFTTVILPKVSIPSVGQVEGVRLVGLSTVREAVQQLPTASYE